LKNRPVVIQYDENGSMVRAIRERGRQIGCDGCRPRVDGHDRAVANGVSDSTIAARGGRLLEERRKLIFVPREAPYNLIHLRNMATLTEAGAMINSGQSLLLHQAEDDCRTRGHDHRASAGSTRHRAPLVKRWQSDA